METDKQQPKNHPFHDQIENGSVSDLETALQQGAEVNSPGQVGMTPLMIAIHIKDRAKLNLLLSHGADPELTDDFNGTALRHAVQHDFVDGVKQLLELKSDRGYQPKYPLKQVDYGEHPIETEVPEEMKEVFTAAEWAESQKEIAEELKKMGETPTVQPMIDDILSVEVLKLFLAAGEDLKDAPSEVKRTYLGLGNDGEFQVAPQEYRQHKARAFGSSNPELMNCPFWRDMVRIGCNAFTARQHFGDEEAHGDPDAVWCFDRFGSSLTQLPDGRFVQIGGEHEDHYDPDFNIYNDVVIHDGKGGFDIFGYPKAVFPPTDFHSATLVEDWIYLIGCLGYVEQQTTDITPVYRLNVRSWEIEMVKTSGENPGWVHGHRASYLASKCVIRIAGGELVHGPESELVSNQDSYELNLESLTWRRT